MRSTVCKCVLAMETAAAVFLKAPSFQCCYELVKADRQNYVPDVMPTVYYGMCLQLYAEIICTTNIPSSQMHRLHKLFLTLTFTYGATLVISTILLPTPQRARSDQDMLVQPFRVLARAAQSRKMSTAAGSEALKKVPAGEHCVLTSPDACDCVG